MSEAKPVFIYSIPHTLSLDCNVVARLYVDEVLAETYRQYEDRGEHVLTVSKHFDDAASERHVIKVTLAFEVVSSDRRIDAAAIATGKKYSDALKAAVTDLAAAIAGKSTATLSLTGETQTVTPLAALSDISATVSYATVQPDTTAGTIHIDRAAIDAVLFARKDSPQPTSGMALSRLPMTCPQTLAWAPLPLRRWARTSRPSLTV